MLKFWNKLINFLSRKLTHEKTRNKSTLNLLLSGNGSTVREFSDRYQITDKVGTYELRKHGSDLDVYRQIIVEQEYQIVQNYFKINGIIPKLIIDCGANIGLTSLLLTHQFKDAKIFAVEPDEGNFLQLLKNIKTQSNIIGLKRAIWSENLKLSIDKSFGDGKDWSIRTLQSTKENQQEVDTITISEIVANSDYEQIDFLKIDIEGAEGEIFKNSETSGFLKFTNCIAIEIHDEFVDRQHIYTILKNYGFKLINSGELTIGFKTVNNV